jgi:ABC-type Mn2+/Zn2+ transport system ATPase subunit
MRTTGSGTGTTSKDVISAPIKGRLRLLSRRHAEEEDKKLDDLSRRLKRVGSRRVKTKLLEGLSGGLMKKATPDEPPARRRGR